MEINFNPYQYLVTAFPDGTLNFECLICKHPTQVAEKGFGIRLPALLTEIWKHDAERHA